MAKKKQKQKSRPKSHPSPQTRTRPSLPPPNQRWVADVLKLDLGCGKNVREGFTGVDVIDFGQKHVVDLRERWPWKDESVDEANASHFVEHLDRKDRVHFVNELYRVLKPGATCLVITPHWCSQRAYGDLTHEWPPVAEFWFYYLKADWRAQNAPHNESLYTCNFEVTWGYSLHPSIIPRPTEYQQNALTWYKEAAQDTVATFKKIVPVDPQPPA